jgi:DNA/RNA endonuclease G (NUC1)
MKGIKSILLKLIIGFTFHFFAFAKNQDPTIRQGDVSVTLLNNHKNVIITSPSGRYSVIYATSYQNPEVALAYLNYNEFGGAGRYKGNFQVLNAPPEVKVTHQTYTGTGYDRGHLISNDFFNFDKELSRETFSVYNICPQLPSFNQGQNGYNAWKDLENSTEKAYANAYGRIYVITGPLFDKAPSQLNKLKNSQCVIPEKFYKIILVQDLKDETYEFTKLEAYIFEHREPRKGEVINMDNCRIVNTNDVEGNLHIIEEQLKLKITLLNGAQESNNSFVYSNGINPAYTSGLKKILIFFFHHYV